MDLIDYFKAANAEEVLKAIPIQQMLAQQIEIIKKINPTKEVISHYIEEWIELTQRLLR